MITDQPTTTADTARLDQLLAATASRHPDRPALSDGETTLRYAELESSVSALAAELAAAGVRPGDHVAVHLPRSAAAVCVIHAVLRAGAVVAPLEVSDPAERTARMLHNAAADFLVTAQRTMDQATSIVRRVTDAVILQATQIGVGLALLPIPAGQRHERYAADGGYLLFTSGSTGWPKGVLLSHRNVLHFVDWAVREFAVTAADRIGSQSALTFDLSTFDIFGAAMAGASVSLLPEALKGFPRDTVRWLAEQRISIFYAVPTLYEALLRRGGIDTTALPQLRVIAFAGEPFGVGALRRYVEIFRHSSFYNLYGPTETNVCTYERLAPDWSGTAGLSIGRALPGLRVELVDRDHAVTDGEGEIAVAGPAVFAGYLQDGRLHRRTTPITWPGGSAPAYLTGDIGVRDQHGKIYLRGRRDHQVKRRGYRIELSDVESVVRELPSVVSCAAVWRPGPAGDGEIWLYVVPVAHRAAALGEAIAAALPRRMAPDRIRVVANLPLTIRGKIDREALASMEPNWGKTP